MTQRLLLKETLKDRILRYRHLTKNFITARVLNREWQASLAKYKNRHSGEDIFIFATGPSVNKMNLAKVKDRVAQGAKVFGVNSYISSSLAQEFPPHFTIFSDPCYIIDETSAYAPEWKKDLDAMTEFHKSVVVLPHHWATESKIATKLAGREILYYNHGENYWGAPNGCNPVKPRYYMAMTAYIAIVLSGYLGFKNIYLLGFDEDQFSGVVLDENQDMIWQDTHFYPESKSRVTRNMTKEIGMTFDDYCIGVVQSNISQRKITADIEAIGAKVLNCNPYSFCAGFPKTKEFIQEEYLRNFETDFDPQKYATK